MANVTQVTLPKVPVDGVILEGHSTLDESMTTGESLPVDKKAGDEAIGATINRTGAFKLRVVHVGSDTALAQIIRLVEEAQGSKAPIQRLADVVTSYFVPVVIGFALLTFVVWLVAGPQPALNYALVNFVAVLIIACPCALGLATPTSIMVGTGKGAENGILIRSGEALENAHKLTAVVFDKTGTLTQGKPVLTDVVTSDLARQAGWVSEAILGLVAGAERRSEHPLGQAIVQGVQARGIPVSEPASFEAIPGHGIAAEVDGHRVLVGNMRLMHQQGVELGNLAGEVTRLSNEGKTPMIIAVDVLPAGVVAVADTL